MKILVISDSHGNIANLKHVMGFAKQIEAKAVVHAGDWNNILAVETVLSYKIPLYTILGNADIDPTVAKKLEESAEGFSEDSLQFKLMGKKFGVIHNIHSLPDVDVLICGHTHQQYEQTVDKVKIINPGALENGINFAVYDIASDKIEFIHE